MNQLSGFQNFVSRMNNLGVSSKSLNYSLENSTPTNIIDTSSPLMSITSLIIGVCALLLAIVLTSTYHVIKRHHRSHQSSHNDYVSV